jgi:hypothetical protein
MRLTYPRAAAVSFALTAILFGLFMLLASCYGPAAPPETFGHAYLRLVFDRSEAVAEDAGLGYGVARWNGLTVRVHDTDGGIGWAPDAVESDAGWTIIYGNAEGGCASHPAPRYVEIASDDYAATALCHEIVVHVARSDFYSADAGRCLGLGDHEYAAAFRIDAKCTEAMRGAKAEALTLTGATGGTD